MDLAGLGSSLGAAASNISVPSARTTGDTLQVDTSPALGQPTICSSFNADRTSAQEISMQTAKRPSSHDFAQQIRQLEIEGSKLRSTTASALGQFGSSGLNLSGCSTPEVSVTQNKQMLSPLTTPLASLVDISAEQKTIADLRVQLENQRRETERLQSHLLADSSAGRTYSNVAFTSPTKSAFSTVPSSELSSITARRAFEFVPPSHMERALKESQEQVIDLRKRLQEATDLSEQQKQQFRANVEELKSKLHETIINRDTVLELRQKEAASQEALIEKLQSSLTQLTEKCRAQEQTLSEMNRQAESSNQSSYATGMAVSQLRAVLAARERARGRPYLEDDPASTSQSAAALALILEKCLQEADREIETRQYKLTQVERELDELKKTALEKEQMAARQHQDRLRAESEDAVQKLSQMTADYEKRLEEANERASNARKQASTLQAQLHVLEEQQQQQSRIKNETITELELKLKQLKQDYADDRARWQERRQALETSLDEVQRELIQARAEKSEAVRSQAAMETKVEDLQMMVSRLEGEVEMERERVQKQREREEELRVKVLGLEGNLGNKQQEVERLERMLDVIKQEASAQMQNRVASAEKQERDRYLDQITSLSSQLTSVNEKNAKLTIDLERARMEEDSLRQQLSDLRLDLQSAQAQGDTTRTEKHHMYQQLEDHRSECERLRQEREHYRRLVEEKSEEVSQLRSSVERATLQLEEKEKVLSTVQQQSCSINQLMEVNSRTSDNMREERERLMKLVETKSTALEESRAAQETMAKKMKLRERRIRELEEERVKLMEEMGVKAQELALLQQEKDNLYAELKDSRVEVSRLSEAKDNFKRDMARLKSSHAKELEKLQARLKEAERDYKLTQRALRSKDSVDKKAVKVADQIQKEITAKRSELDNLRSKARRLEEKYDTVQREKLMVERDKDSLKSSLARSLLHSTQLTEELEASHAQNSQLQRRVKQLEEALEKEAIKCASTQAQLEQFEQEIATLKLKHQLDLKEAAQLSQNKSAKMSWISVNDNVGPAPSQTQARTKSRSATPSPRPGSVEKMFPYTHKAPPEAYTEAGRELKQLLGEMRQLIAVQREVNEKSEEVPSRPQSSSRRPRVPRRRSRSSSPDKLASNFSTADDYDQSLSMSYPPRADVSAGSRSNATRSNPPSPRRQRVNVSSDADYTRGTSFLSRGSQSDISNLTTSYSGSPFVGTGGAVTMVPDTQELCRRLEEKIANLTRMGSNLQQENQEMAQLISAQGQKLEVVRKNERNISHNRR